MLFYIGAETTMLFGVGLTRGRDGRIGAASTCFLYNGSHSSDGKQVLNSNGQHEN